jgi:hypothetical protein
LIRNLTASSSHILPKPSGFFLFLPFYPIALNMNRWKSQWPWLALLLLLATACWWLLTQDRQSTLNPQDTAFALQDTGLARRIHLIQVREGREITRIELTRSDGSPWMVNHTFPAFQPQVGHLLTTLHRLQVRESLTGKGLESADKILSLMHTRVEVVGNSGPVKTYLLGTSAKDNKGSLMKLEGASRAFIVERPDVQGFINPFFNIDLDLWREKLLWRASEPQLSSIQIERTRQPENNLLLARLPESGWAFQPGGERPDSLSLAAYLAQFQGAVFAETFAAREFPETLDSLRALPPDIRFRLGYASGETRDILLYERADNPNSYFGWVAGEEELYTIQHFVFDRFLRTPGQLRGPAL